MVSLTSMEERSQFVKAAALNAEFTIKMQEEIRKPKL